MEERCSECGQPTPPPPPQTEGEEKCEVCGGAKYIYRRCKFHIERSPIMGGFVDTFRTQEGAMLLNRFEEYQRLARVGKVSYDAVETNIKAVGLILLDAIESMKKPAA